ncbi:hypothetical protein [Nitriliruptor alkaliphilus]|uniref:hypothetical protein n=1 Tax=Nitriliruptor alkaliphilus TaxID=427918 RepID=UPI00069687F4|nr:hypothetical protein [Nitriliruptor alkaliphilus]
MIATSAQLVSSTGTAAAPTPGLADLEAQLLALSALSEDDHLFVLGQALDTAAALLAAHARRAAA